MRGGGPRYHFNHDYLGRSLRKGNTNLQQTLLMNNSMPQTYREDLLPIKKLTKQQLHIIAGVEMHYGNFEDFKWLYASREVPALAHFMNALTERRDRIENMSTIIAREGIAKLSEEKERISKLEDRIEEHKKTLLKHAKELRKYNITEDDIAGLEQQ